MRVLDLSYLDKNDLVNRVLRQNWRERTKVDPLVAPRKEEFISKLFWWRFTLAVSFFFLSTPFFWSQAGDLVGSGRLGFVLLCSVSLAAVAWFCTSIWLLDKPSDDERSSATGFSEALDRLYGILGKCSLANVSELELIDMAREKLLQPALDVKNAEGLSKEVRGIVLDRYQDLHYLFYKFGLVGSDCQTTLESLQRGPQLDPTEEVTGGSGEGEVEQALTSSPESFNRPMGPSAPPDFVPHS